MIYTIGETVLDIIFKSFDDVKVKPGGSMLNTAVSLGRLGVKVSHISSISSDKVSDLLIEFLQENGVDTNYMHRNTNINTSLALAHLNNNNDAEYTFYKEKTTNAIDLEFPIVNKNSIIHYGSFFSINSNVHNQLHSFLGKVNDEEGIKLYDPNFRKPHLPQLTQLIPMIENNFRMADIVKASDEDFENIFGIKSGVEAWRLMKNYEVAVLFYTKGKDGSELFCNKGKLSSKAKQIDVMSTIGAGDTYSSGIIYFLNSIIDNEVSLNEITMVQWQECVRIAHEFSAQTCQSFDNYLSKEYCDNL